MVGQILQPISRATGRILNPPTSIFMAITDECFMRCRMCDMWKSKDGPDVLTTDEKLDAIRQLRDWLGPTRVSFTGGEPLMKHQELFALSRYCVERDILTSTNTAGLSLTDRMVDELLDSGLTELHISLDSLSEEVCDSIRGRPGTFRRIMSAITRITRRSRRLRLSTRAIISSYNINELVSMVKWGEEVGLDGVGFHPLDSKFSFGGREAFNPEWFKSDDMWPQDPAKVAAVLDELMGMKRAGHRIDTSVEHLKKYKQYYRDPNSIGAKRGCYTGVRNLIIGVTGDVHLCFLFPPLGNIRQTDIRKIWRSHNAGGQRASIKNCIRNCNILACNRRSNLTSQIIPFLQRIIRS